MSITVALEIEPRSFLNKMAYRLLKGVLVGHPFYTNLYVWNTGKEKLDLNYRMVILSSQKDRFAGFDEFSVLLFDEDDMYENTKWYSARYPGIHEIEIHFQNEDNDFVIIDNDDGISSNYTLRDEFDEEIIQSKYTVIPFRVFTINDLLLFVFAGVSVVGALSEIISLALRLYTGI